MIFIYDLHIEPKRSKTNHTHPIEEEVKPIGAKMNFKPLFCVVALAIILLVNCVSAQEDYIDREICQTTTSIFKCVGCCWKAGYKKGVVFEVTGIRKIAVDECHCMYKKN